MDKSERDSLIRETVRETIRQLKAEGLLRRTSDQEYKAATAALRAFYDGGQTDAAVKAAVESVQDDAYAKIIPLYFDYGYKIEDLAEQFGCEVSTISRNKKRLSLLIYERLEN